MINVAKWIILSERSSMQSPTYHIFQFYEMSRKCKIIETHNRSAVAEGWGWKQRKTAHRQEGT